MLSIIELFKLINGDKLKAPLIEHFFFIYKRNIITQLIIQYEFISILWRFLSSCVSFILTKKVCMKKYLFVSLIYDDLSLSFEFSSIYLVIFIQFHSFLTWTGLFGLYMNTMLNINRVQFHGIFFHVVVLFNIKIATKIDKQ